MEDYIEKVLRTESNDYKLIEDRICNKLVIRLDHAADGMVTEAGEFKDTLKKWKYYGKELDKVNLVEELGDLLYYIGLGCDALGVTLDEVQQINIAKLEARYPDKFTSDKAINRNLDAERKILEDVN